MNIISRIMGVDKTPEDKYKYIWFTMGTACFALATLVMTIVISRFLGEAKAGMFSIGLSIAQWLVTIAYFEIRTYQVTDVKNEYPFGYYFTLRLMMCLITFLASIVYVVFNGYSPEKVTVILLVCIYKILDSVADTFEGEFQKEERIDMSGKSEFYRIFFSILVLVVCRTWKSAPHSRCRPDTRKSPCSTNRGCGRRRAGQPCAACPRCPSP